MRARITADSSANSDAACSLTDDRFSASNKLTCAAFWF
jgi:hypothetical protein